jgi:Rrf2 family iron-sulfur cluster assembly transcriptional regulator
MRISTKTRYAITAMLDLALYGGDKPVTLHDISKNQGISLSYLEQLFAKLRAKQLVRGMRGPGGGYYLGRPPEEINVGEVICAVDDYVEMTHCNDDEGAGQTDNPTHQLWGDFSGDLFNFLAGISIAELAQRRGHVLGSLNINDQ